jgi:S-adenosylmethionine:tRNA ribosyltransferase-isomerase
VIQLPGDATFEVETRSAHGGWEGVWTSTSGKDFQDWLSAVGVPPLPPYIKRPAEASDFDRYQTVYAREPGSVAAPTAGLHFTPELLKQLEEGGAEIARLTLNVGWGTFEPIKTTDLQQHIMHSESYDIPSGTARVVNNARNDVRKVLAVGTTSVRALEAAASINMPIHEGAGDASIFIYPPFNFKIVDRVLTNFHRPDSTLLQLIAAKTGWELLNTAYQRALEEDFRFFSYGDAMLIV